MKPLYVILHTVAAKRKVEKSEIDEWHKANGWSGFGYHWYIRYDGTIEQGRPENVKGAHCKAGGRNNDSIGICFEGHGDLEPWTTSQLVAFKSHAASIMKRHQIPPQNWQGHNEYESNKTCPGKLIDMDEVRNILQPIWLRL